MNDVIQKALELFVWATISIVTTEPEVWVGRVASVLGTLLGTFLLARGPGGVALFLFQGRKARHWPLVQWSWAASWFLRHPFQAYASKYKTDLQQAVLMASTKQEVINELQKTIRILETKLAAGPKYVGHAPECACEECDNRRTAPAGTCIECTACGKRTNKVVDGNHLSPTGAVCTCKNWRLAQAKADPEEVCCR